MTRDPSIRLGGWSLIVGAAAFVGVFTYLAASFDYPAILDGPAATVLPRLRATGATGRMVWALYAFLPLLWIPAGVGAYRALRGSHPGFMLLGLQCTVVGALSMMLGLMRWPTIHWRLAEELATADSSRQAVLTAMFDGLNSYLGNFIGEALGELSVNAFFFLSAWALWQSQAVPRWLASFGLVTAVVGLIGLWRNVTPPVGPVAGLDNYLLPLWIVAFGVILLRLGRTAPSP
jgi:hypothetical protein